MKSVQDYKIEDLKKDVDTHTKQLDVLMTNHLPHLQASVTKTETNVDWLMRFFWIIAAASIGGFITGIWNLLK